MRGPRRLVFFFGKGAEVALTGVRDTDGRFVIKSSGGFLTESERKRLIRFLGGKV